MIEYMTCRTCGQRVYQPLDQEKFCGMCNYCSNLPPEPTMTFSSHLKSNFVMWASLIGTIAAIIFGWCFFLGAFFGLYKLLTH